MELNEAISKLLYQGSALIGIATSERYTFELIERSNVSRNQSPSGDQYQRKLLTKVRITEVPEGSILLKMDKCKMSSGIQPSTGLLKQCDYALVIPSMRHVSYIELKSSTINRESIRDQLRSSHCAFCYISHALMDVFGVDEVSCQYVSSFILMHTQALPTVCQPEVIKEQGKTPDNFRPIVNPTTIHFRLLI